MTSGVNYPNYNNSFNSSGSPYANNNQYYPNPSANIFQSGNQNYPSYPQRYSFPVYQPYSNLSIGGYNQGTLAYYNAQSLYDEAQAENRFINGFNSLTGNMFRVG